MLSENALQKTEIQQMRIGSNLFVGGVRELHNPPNF